MSEPKSRYAVEATVEAGRADRQDSIVTTAIDFRQLLWHAGNDGRFQPYLVEVHELDEQGQVQAAAPCQWDNGVVSWVVQGALPAGSRRRYRIGFDAEDAPALKQES